MAKKQPETMKLKMLRGTRVDGKSVAPDQVVTVDLKTGSYLVGMGKAVPVKAPPQRGETLTTEDAAPLTRSNKGKG